MAPVKTFSLLLGKTIPYYLTSVAQCALLFLCGRMLFGMPWGTEPELLIPIVLCTSASATGLGILLSTIVRTDQQIASYGTALILVLSALSGSFLPRELFPKTMKQVSYFTPHAWSLEAFNEVLNQPHIDSHLVAYCCGVLLLFAAACFAAGWWRFNATARR
jgi:ABC-2 type transport system permease protein